MRVRRSGKTRRRSEIRICGHDNPFLVASADEDRLAIGPLKAILPDMHGVVPVLSQSLGNEWRQCIVHQELHGAIKGNSRSRTASAA
jgi:hypothetical protein